METVEKSEMAFQEVMSVEFCQKHINLHEESGLSIKEYCKINSIHYARFLYKIRKVSFGGASASDTSMSLIAVKLKNKSEPHLSSETMCTLIFKNGILLKIHTMEALSYILERTG